MDTSLTESYDYTLPPSQIATHPAHPKDSSKLLVYDRSNDIITHATFKDILDFIPKGCVVLYNDTKVIKARIYGAKSSGGKVELLLNKPLANNTYSVYIKGKVKVDTELVFDNALSAKVVALIEDGSRVVEFFHKSVLIEDFTKLIEILSHIGHIPLPPYINREDTAEDADEYQPTFAQNDGAVAAPTASLHFTPELFTRLQTLHENAPLTLHVGAGTFKGVEAEKIQEHQIHSEYYQLSKKARELIESKKELLAIGTTVTRTIEYYHQTSNPSGECDIFINPYNPPKRVNHLLTNFHLPKSTLIMLVSAFVGLEKTKELYQIAIENDYRFYSYGDAMLIL